MNNILRKKYSREESINETLKYFNNDKLAADVFVNKYALKDSHNNLYELIPDDMHRRIAKELARIEMKYPNPISENDIYESLRGFKRIVPQGSPMSGIGNEMQITSIGNCFVVGNKFDSYGSIFMTDQEQAQLMKRRGGVGHDLSYIRPNTSPVKNDALTSTGIVPFMERYSNTTKEVAQSGRRGALMLSLSIKHPDVEDFIDAKLEQNKITGANISVRIDNDFMNAAMDNKNYLQTFPIDLKEKYPNIINRYVDNLSLNNDMNVLKMVYDENNNHVGFIKKVSANKLWKKIIHNAWKSAEPGILFWDTLSNESISSCYGEEWIETSTNPCGELPLPPYDSCRLLAINLYGYVVNGFTENAYFDWNSFERDVIWSQRFMDDILDLELEKIDKILEKIVSDPETDEIKNIEINLWKKIKNKAINGRRTGLGVTGEGDMLAALNFIYGSEDANDFSEKIHKTLKLNAYKSSVIMAKERGAFPMYDSEKEMKNPFILRIKNEDNDLYEMMLKYGRRNLALLTIAPTGSVSILTQTTSGIECAFLIYYKRRRKVNPQEKNIKVDYVDSEGICWEEYLVFHHKFEEYLKVKGYDVEWIKKHADENYINDLIKKSPYFGATSNDVDWVKKVEMQGRIQKHVDHSISVTVNLPEFATEEIVTKVYETGWRSLCKGITVYRDKSRSGVLVTAETKQEKEEKMFKDNHAPKRPKKLKGEIIRFQNNNEKWIAVVGLLDGRPYEIFTGRLENGLSKLPLSVKECEIIKNKIENNISRYDIEYIDGNKIIRIEGISEKFNKEYWNYAKLISSILRHGMPLIYVYSLIDSLTFNVDYINTWKNGVGRVIKKFIPNGEKMKRTCPNCGSETLEFIEGCLTCKNCGNSKCG